MRDLCCNPLSCIPVYRRAKKSSHEDFITVPAISRRRYWPSTYSSLLFESDSEDLDVFSCGNLFLLNISLLKFALYCNFSLLQIPSCLHRVVGGRNAEVFCERQMHEMSILLQKVHRLSFFSCWIMWSGGGICHSWCLDFFCSRGSSRLLRKYQPAPAFERMTFLVAVLPICRTRTHQAAKE